MAEVESGGRAGDRTEPVVAEQAGREQAGREQANVRSEARPPGLHHEPVLEVRDEPGLDDQDGRGHRRGRIGAVLLTLIGALSLVCGLTWALITVEGPEPFVDLASGLIMALGGLVLLMPHRIRLPGAPTTIAAIVTGVGGTAAGLASATATACCMFAYIEDRGFPYVWLQRGGVADDPEVAQRLAATDAWNADVSMLTMNLIIWAYLGVLVVALAVLVRRATRRR